MPQPTWAQKRCSPEYPQASPQAMSLPGPPLSPRGDGQTLPCPIPMPSLLRSGITQGASEHLGWAKDTNPMAAEGELGFHQLSTSLSLQHLEIRQVLTETGW